MREAKVEKYFQDTVGRLGGKTRKLSYVSRNGATDQLALFPRYHCVVEIKAPGEKPRRNQNREHKVLRWAGFDVFVLDSIDAVNEWAHEIQENITCQNRPKILTPV